MTNVKLANPSKRCNRLNVYIIQRMACIKTHTQATNRFASLGDFSYSEALKGKGGNWSYDNLDHFIAAPKAFASGTKMAYGGEKDAAKRADIIAYLRSMADTPAPLPGK